MPGEHPGNLLVLIPQPLQSAGVVIRHSGDTHDKFPSVVDLKLLLLNAANAYSNFKSKTTPETYIRQ